MGASFFIYFILGFIIGIGLLDYVKSEKFADESAIKELLKIREKGLN